MTDHEVHAAVSVSHVAATIARRRAGVVANLCTQLDESSIAGTPECEQLKTQVRAVINSYADGITTLLRAAVTEIDPRVLDLIASIDTKLDDLLTPSERIGAG